MKQVSGDREASCTGHKDHVFPNNGTREESRDGTQDDQHQGQQHSALCRVLKCLPQVPKTVMEPYEYTVQEPRTIIDEQVISVPKTVMEEQVMRRIAGS